MNGHIALNEPAPSLHTNCHVAHLSQKSLQHPMIAGDTEKPGYGLTLGMANIFQSRLIILLCKPRRPAALISSPFPFPTAERGTGTPENIISLPSGFPEGIF